MRYWWVNQNQTYKHEVPGGYLWSPKVKKGGSRNPFYDTMKEVTAGDLVFSFCDTRIKAIGVAVGPAASSEKPDFGMVGDQWHDDGWLVPVEFEEVSNPVRPKDFVDKLLPHFGPRYNPLRTTGDGKQSVYLAEVSQNFASALLAEMGRSLDDIGAEQQVEEEQEAEEEQTSLEGRTDIRETQKRQMVLARRGQGVFRANVRLNERCCRVTGVKDPALLIASHIKPWAKSNDKEKLDGCNGLLLSPHVDRLFDRGLLSFADDGEVLRSTQVSDGVWGAWGLADIKNVGSFSDKQRLYLSYHRKSVLKQ